jgi:hypothetical protein
MVVKLKINDEPIGIKEYVQHTFAGVILGLLTEIRDINLKEVKKILITITPNKTEPEQVIVEVDGNCPALKSFVQQMIWRTLVGFISSLNKVPPTWDDLMKAVISIEYKP